MGSIGRLGGLRSEQAEGSIIAQKLDAPSNGRATASLEDLPGEMLGLIGSFGCYGELKLVSREVYQLTRTIPRERLRWNSLDGMLRDYVRPDLQESWDGFRKLNLAGLLEALERVPTAQIQRKLMSARRLELTLSFEDLKALGSWLSTRGTEVMPEILGAIQGLDLRGALVDFNTRMYARAGIHRNPQEVNEAAAIIERQVGHAVRALKDMPKIEVLDLRENAVELATPDSQAALQAAMQKTRTLPASLRSSASPTSPPSMRDMPSAI